LDNRLYKCSAVDEIGDRFATVDMDRKEGGPNFRHICCGQMAVWIKMSLGMELGLELLSPQLWTAMYNSYRLEM